jgi:rare lipoprotein A (peptidoglycan hydrolase)
MNLRFAIGSSAAALVLLSGAIAVQMPGQAAADSGDTAVPTPRDRTGDRVTGDAVIEIATVAQEFARVASTTAVIAAPPLGDATGFTQTPAPVRNRTDLAKTTTAKTAVKDKLATKSDARNGVSDRHQQLAAADPKPVLVRAVGKSETGTAAWYGGRYLGRRTSSGERLDTVHPTAAHRTLPLNSLARVTNLENGRSIIVRVTDRGPVSDSLLIDMSPRAADQLEMKEAGLVQVKVEQVVAVPPDSK